MVTVIQRMLSKYNFLMFFPPLQFIFTKIVFPKTVQEMHIFWTIIYFPSCVTSVTQTYYIIFTLKFFNCWYFNIYYFRYIFINCGTMKLASKNYFKNLIKEDSIIVLKYHNTFIYKYCYTICHNVKTTLSQMASLKTFKTF